MSPSSHPAAIDRYTNIGELTEKVRQAVRRSLLPLLAVLAIETAYLGLAGRPGAAAFGLIAAGTWAALALWGREGLGLPLLPIIMVQNLVIYGVPIAAGHQTITSYPADFVLRAGREVLIFDLAIALAWAAGMRFFRPSAPVSHVLHEFSRAGARGWSRLGFAMIIGATAFYVVQGLDLLGGLYALLPGGSDSILYAVVSVASACGFFLVSMTIAGDEASPLAQVLFWLLLAGSAMMSASDFLLSAAAANLITVAIGFFWSRGRVPWGYLAVALLALSFFNLGKATMRARYWGNPDLPAPTRSFGQLPACYEEWIQVSYHALLENDTETSRAAAEGPASRNQTLLDRIDNLQNLLFVIDAIDTDHIKPLEGKTYSLIPPLLVPRVLWPDKPRSHEGQILLNVHFGRQDLESTLTTYIAWGLLPEAYGNFGALAGSVGLGVFLGLLFAWIENLTARKLLVSMEGFLCLSLLINLVNSFEMVASVLVTSVFQSFVVILAASLPFVHREAGPRPPSEET
jgi:hypothetical protein